MGRSLDWYRHQRWNDNRTDYRGRYHSSIRDNRKVARYAEENGWDWAAMGLAKNWPSRARIVVIEPGGNIACSINPFHGEEILVEGFANKVYAMSFADWLMEQSGMEQEQPITRDVVLAHRTAYTPTLH